MPNRLARASSPYLLQHQNNPVDWYPWGAEALERARAEDKPIFLSIGYSACHWCHVMEHESFEDPTIAAFLNEHFVSIKVDREERPDLDQIYMNAVQMLTGHGGWPMSVFLLPDQRPFYGGTYWPPQQRMGMPGFMQVLGAIQQAWQDRRAQIETQSQEILEHLQSPSSQQGEASELNESLLRAAVASLAQAFDSRHGGFGRAPKFPRPMDLQVLLRAGRRFHEHSYWGMVSLTLRKMWEGGIYDHLGGGFARYSTDERWLVPHFEKMLYDNALLVDVYLDAIQYSKQRDLRIPVRETLDYVLTRMTDDAGPFHSTEDADSEGVEGKFYVWTKREVRDILGAERAERFAAAYDVSDEGNWEGHSILNRPRPLAEIAEALQLPLAQLEAELAEDRARLFHAREQRVPPGKDDKVLVSWNGLMIHSMARAAGILDEPRYLEAAVRAAEFLWTSMRTNEGRLLHTWRRGSATLPAYLDDYASLANALVTLYEQTFEKRWIERATQLCEQMLTHFEDSEAGGFYFTADDHEQLILRQKDFQDGSIPSGNGLAATVLLRLGHFLGEARYLESARRTIDAATPLLTRYPQAAAQTLIALDWQLGPVDEIVLSAEFAAQDGRRLLENLRQRYFPCAIVAAGQPSAAPPHSDTGMTHNPLAGMLAGKEQHGAEPTAYWCRNFACQAPTVGLQATFAWWDQQEVTLSPRDAKNRQD